ncbi:unnamed protein product [Gordionus sp. m RMFG-2023]
MIVFNEPKSKILHEVCLLFRGEQNCRKDNDKTYSSIADNVICIDVGGRDGQGDSGGLYPVALTVYGVIGIVSSSGKCGMKGHNESQRV